MITKEQKEKIDHETQKTACNISQIKHCIVIFSGKGGVGKTTVSVNIAYGLQVHGYKTGILDTDITGPNVPKMINEFSGNVVCEKLDYLIADFSRCK